MRFINQRYGIEFPVQDGRVNVVCIENRQCFSNLLCDLWQQVNGLNGETIISDVNYNMKFNKDIELIFNPFALDCNDKKIISALYKEIKETAEDMLQDHTMIIKTHIIDYLDDLLEKNIYSTTFDTDFDIIGFLKLFDVRIEHSYDTLVDLLICYIKLKNRLCNIRYYIFVNLKQYLSDEDLAYLYEAAEYENINLILLEDSQRGIISRENTIIIDNDLCLIILN